MRTLIVLAVLGFVLAAAVPRHVGRIIGGSETSIEAYPYLANLQYAVFGVYWTQFCGGALLTPFSILTAAHCVDGDPPQQWRAFLGTSLRSTGGTLHNITRFSIHPENNRTTFDADIGIVHLASGAVLSTTVQTVAIASPSTILFPGLPVTAMGWGYNEDEGSLHLEQLQHVEVNIIDQQLCAARYADLKTQPEISSIFPDITPGMACSGILDVGGKGACYFDNGGPVVHRGDIHIVVGVTSFNYRCGDQGRILKFGAPGQ